MNQPIAMNTTRKHVVWLDVVRLVAMFTVVCCHSADPFNFYPGEPPANIDEIKFWGAAYGAFLRPCVPLFVMITGALLLPVRGEISAFYKKRISRVFWPFLIWSAYAEKNENHGWGSNSNRGGISGSGRLCQPV